MFIVNLIGFNVTLNNITAICLSWLSVLVRDEDGVHLKSRRHWSLCCPILSTELTMSNKITCSITLSDMMQKQNTSKCKTFL